MNNELNYWADKNKGNSKYDITDKYCVVIGPGVLDTFYDTKEEAIEAAADYISGFDSCKHSKDEIIKELKENGYVSGDDTAYAAIYNTVSKKRELAVDCYLYIDMLPGETEHEAYDRLAGLIPNEIDVNLGHTEVRDIV